MAVSIVQGPDGRQHEVQHPEGIASSQIVKYAQRQIASSANAEDGFIVDVGKGLFNGASQAAVSSAAGVTQWVGQAYGSESLLQAAEDMRQFGQGVADDIGLDEDFRQSFFGQVVQGLGQVPVTIAAGAAGFAVAGPVGAFGAAAITTGGQMSSEFLGDMEQTLGKGYTDFNSNEKANALTGMLAQTALGTTLEMAAIGKALRPLLKKMGTTGVSSKLLKKAIGKDRGALRELVEAAGAEGLTEAAQGQSLDTLASLLYDEDRELITFDTLKRRTMEFGVGAIVGGTVSGGAQLIGGAPSAPSGGKKADLKKPVQERSELTIPDSVTVTYKPIDGPVKTVSLAIDAGQDPRAAVEAELAGRYDTTYPMQIDTVSSPVPVGPEQELDLPDQAPDPTQEQVPVQPEASLIDQSNINRPPVVDQDSMPTLTPEEFDRRLEGQPTPEQIPVQPEPAVDEGIGPYDDSELTEPNSTTGNVKTLNEIFDLGKKSWENTSGDPRRAQGTSNTIGKNFGEKAKEAHMRGWKSSMEAELKERQARKAPTPEQAPEPELSNIQARAKQAGMSEEQFRSQFPAVVDQLEKPATEQAPEARSFSLPQNLKKGKPGYAQTQNITFASDLERASYSATTKTKSDPATRKRQQYRNLLKESGYSDAEINTMGAEVRAQMKGQYKGKGSPISVSLGQDVAAEASATYMPKRFVGDQAAKAPPFFQSFSPEQYDEGRFVDLETKQDLSNKTFEGGSIRIEGGRPVLETSDNAGETILDSKASEEGPLVRTNLFKQKAGWKWTKAPDGAPSTIVSVEQGPKHYYTLDFSSAKPLTLKTYPSKKSEPRGRPTTRGKVKLGNPVGEISIRGKKHTVYDQVTVGELGVLSEEGAGLTEQEIKDGQEGEQGLVADTPVTGDVVADAAQFKPSRPVSVPNAPVISRSSLRGKSGFIYFSDRTRVGTYTGLNSESGISIPLQGGMGYAFIPKNVEAEAGWAFTTDNIFTRFNDQLNKTDGIGFVALYTKENLRANNTFLLAYTAELNYALQSGTLTKADFKSEANGLRERALKKKVTNQKTKVVSDYISRDVSWFKLWDKKWNTAEDLQAALNAAGFDTRAYAFSIKKATTKNAKPGDLSGGQLASKRAVKKGFPNVIDMIDLFVEPDLADRERGEIVGAVQFQKGQESAVSASDIGSDNHLSYPLVIRGRGIGVFDSTVNVLDVIKTQKEKNQALRSAETSFPISKDVGEDVTAQATDTEVEDRGPRDTYDNGGQVQDAIEQEFDPIGKKINVKIVMRMKTDYVARYNATQGIIEYNPMLLLKRSKAGIRAAMREEIIHAAMHKVIMVSARKKFSMAEGGKGWTDFFGEFGKSLTDAERADIKDVYQNIKPEDYVAYGSEYSRAVIQNLLYGEFSEEYQMQSQGGPAWNTIVKLLRSVQAYMAKVLGPMIKTNPEAAQVIVDSVELLKAVDPSIRPKSQDVVAKAYDATDKNTAKENTEAGERVGKDSSERIREERKWFDGAFRKTASKYLTPVITRLNRIHPMFGRILQNLDSAIRMRSMGYRKQTEMFFNKLNAVKGAEFQELKQLIFFSPTPEEANLPSNKAKMQRRDALLHKHGLLNMYRLDVQPILEEIYAEYTALGMPKIGYLEDYFPRVIKDLEGLIKSYGHKTKRTFELLVNEENIRRSELKDKDGNPAPLPEMQETELGRFFQDFLQGKFRVDLNGVKLPGNVKAREIQLIPEDKLKFYDEPGVAFGKYTTNMARAIESFKVVGDTKKGEGRLLGELGKLTEELFTAGQIDQADASEVKSLTELITSQFQAENQILKSLGTLTYMATLINPGPVLVQIMDLYKVALYRGLGGVVSGTYRTVTGNRRFDIERDFGIAKTQLSAEFEDPSFLTKALDFGLSRLVPFRQMDTAMKHASIEAAYDDFVKKAKAPVGSKKYQQLLDELTITMGREDALKTISDLRLDKAMESTLVKEALLAELLQRQPLTYLQVPEGYQTDPSKRLFYKLSTFMLLDLNYNRQEFMNDLGGPGKTLKQRTVALRRLAYMATLLTMFGLPSDLLDDWISGKDTYIPEHVMNNMLGMFGLSRYTTSSALNKGAVESVIQRFTPPAINIMIDGEQSLRSWVKGDKELFDIKAWRYSPLSDVWFYKTGAGAESQKKWQNKQKKEGIIPTFDR
jgi:hypothetical protein